MPVTARTAALTPSLRPLRLALALLAAAAPAAAPVRAQEPSAVVTPVQAFASLRGSVADRFGGPLSGVEVVLSHDATGERRSTKTAADATFEFTNLPGGRYSLEASRPGFARAFRDVTLMDEEHGTQAMTLQVADIDEMLRIVSGGATASAAPAAVATSGQSGDRPSEPSRERVCGADGSGCVVPARKVADVRPQYPPSASQRGIEGIVAAEAVIDEQGLVTGVQVIRPSDELLDAAVVEAVRQWQYVPTTLNGVPTRSVLTVTVEFALAERVRYFQ
jgi:TonB family protein